MVSNIEASRRSMIELLEQTRRVTRSTLSGLDPAFVVHGDERAWRVRDVIGHLAAWNVEAARSLAAHASGRAYTCISSRSKYYDYNGPAADERKQWTVEQVWAEYEASHDQLRSAVQAIPADRWESAVLYPWNERGTVEGLIKKMMKHEKVDHCNLIVKAVSS